MQLRQVQNECRGRRGTIKKLFCCIYFSSPHQDQSERNVNVINQCQEDLLKYIKR